MKYLPLIFLLGPLVACHQRTYDESFPVLEVTESEWATYEGLVRLDNGELLDVELSLKEAQVGLESYYNLNGVLRDTKSIYACRFQGRYTVTPGVSDNLFGIHLEYTNIFASSDGHFIRNISEMRDKLPAGIKAELEDLYFITSGDGHLMQADDNFVPLSSEDIYTIHKRSRLFTVEGYMTVLRNDSSEFFERNTQENWSVAPYGVLPQITDAYYTMATEPNEGVYMRALAFTIKDQTLTGEPQERLVLKKIIQMGL